MLIHNTSQDFLQLTVSFGKQDVGTGSDVSSPSIDSTC